MLSFHLSLSNTQHKALQVRLASAEAKGDLAEAKRLWSLLALAAGQWLEDIVDILQISRETLRLTVKKYLTQGLPAIPSKRSPGRPAKLTKQQRRQLARWIEAGPEKMGFPGYCWRTPMLQHLIRERFQVYYSVRYLSELLHNMGFSFQKATFVSDKQDVAKREAWLTKTWPKIVQLATRKNAHLYFEDESSFPQWGTLNYTWARRGQQPVVKTSGNRRSYKVFGVIDYFTGHFLAKGHEGRLNAKSYQEFLEALLRQTRKHIILIHDQAGYHTCPAIIAFLKEHRDRITVFELPSYSPDYNPIEKLWKKIKQWGIHLCYFPTFDALKEKVNAMLLLFKDTKKEVLKLFVFYDKLAVT